MWQSQGSAKIRTARNLGALSLACLSVGWLGILLNRALGGESHQGPGMLLWLLGPLLVSLLFRAAGGDGWADLGLRPRWRSNPATYALCIAFYPVCLALVVGLGRLLGFSHGSGFAAYGWATFWALAATQLGASLVKNALEELVWRGHLTPKLALLDTSPLVNHLFVGVIWSGWHVPYWLGLLDKATLARFTGLGLPAFVLLSVIGLMASALLYGELRLLTGSVWPPLLLHSVGNALTLTLLMERFLAVDRAGQAIFSPSMGGLLLTALTLVAAVWIAQRRTAS